MGRIMKYTGFVLAAVILSFWAAGCGDIGMRGVVDDSTTEDPVYEWVRMPKLKAPTPGLNNHFGYFVDISDDYAVIGAFNINTTTGAVYIFKKGNGWEYQQTLTAGDGSTGHAFGWSVAISGNYIVVGAPGFGGGGAAYLFEFNGSSWIIPSALTNGHLNLPGTPVEAGYSVAIDGAYVCVGSPGTDTNNGAVYIFFKDQGSSNSWGYQQTRSSGESDPDRYGESVSLSNVYLLVGAPLDDENESNSGAAYIHKRTGSSWSSPEKIKVNDPSQDVMFGKSVSIYGSRAISGSPGNNSVYLFEIAGSNWNQIAKIISSDSAGLDEFGHAVSVADGFIVIGSPYHNTQGFSNAGSAYIFENGVDNNESLIINSDSPAASDNLGKSVSISNHYAIIGVPYDNESQSGSGAVYICEYQKKN